MNVSNWNWSQIISVGSALLAVVVGLLSMAVGWMTPVQGIGLVLAGLSLLGIHTGGTVAGNTK